MSDKDRPEPAQECCILRAALSTVPPMARTAQTLRGPRLTIVGLGTSGLRHLTTETASHLRGAQLVLALSPHIAELKHFNPHVVSLEDLYWSNATDWDTYRRLAKVVVQYA